MTNSEKILDNLPDYNSVIREGEKYKSIQEHNEGKLKQFYGSVADKYMQKSREIANSNNPLVGTFELMKMSVKDIYQDFDGNKRLWSEDPEEALLNKRARVLAVSCVIANTVFNLAALTAVDILLAKRGIKPDTNFQMLLAMAITAPIAGPLTEETAKLAAHRMGCLTQFQSQFNLMEFSQYVSVGLIGQLAGGKPSVKTIALILLARFLCVFIHHFSSYNLNRDDISEMEAYFMNIAGHFVHNVLSSIASLTPILLAIKPLGKLNNTKYKSVTSKRYLNDLINTPKKTLEQMAKKGKFANKANMFALGAFGVAGGSAMLYHKLRENNVQSSVKTDLFNMNLRNIEKSVTESAKPHAGKAVAGALIGGASGYALHKYKKKRLNEVESSVEFLPLSNEVTAKVKPWDKAKLAIGGAALAGAVGGMHYFSEQKRHVPQQQNIQSPDSYSKDLYYK